ncbi:MAG: aminotransferase class I/II-fold pyridoxal phosphate-dependent enzyme [Candidatus Saganbacteria bacterium]|nr:aminotransferase class I/II-fold pyridoxal phosphate-dependent enzyme [Candidatus Saganbacteria bacterium]
MKGKADRLSKLPEYVFAALDRIKAEERAKGADLIDLGMGNPDIPPPPEVIETLNTVLKDPANSRYPAFEGTEEFRKAVSIWCKKQYGVDINCETEVTPLIGSKEGLIHFAFSLINPGDITLLPMPAYPAHFNGTLLCGGEIHPLPSNQQTGFVPNLDEVDPGVAKRAKLLILSYPSNPTAACCTKELHEQAVRFCKKYDIIYIHDFAYAEIYLGGVKPPSALSVPGAKDVCIEFQTLSKTFGMAGWRCGFAVGNKDLIKQLSSIKHNLDYGLFMGIQYAAAAALTKTEPAYFEKVRETYKKRRDIFVEGMNKLGWNIKKPEATMYVWFPIPKGFNSSSFAMEILKKTGVVVAAGTAFGELGEGFARAALVVKEERIKEAIDRIAKAGICFR